MKQYIYLVLFIIGSYHSSLAQVGINIADPTETLEVNGTTTVREKLYLEAPGFVGIGDKNFLVKKADNTWAQHNATTANYAPINYTQLKFTNVPSSGLVSFNTGINATDYTVAVQGYYYYVAGGTNTNVSLLSRGGTQTSRVEGTQFYAYINTSTNTWHIKGAVNNSDFRAASGYDIQNTAIDLFMNVVIFRKKFFTKEHSNITVNMDGSATGTAPLPTAFQP